MIMEEEAERMAALKRAYAEIILSTAKESAARVLAAERRAVGFQKSMFAVKEEALATMLRLKAIMEAKIREAEKTVLCRTKKIEELELQLGEAEDTIVDLREELKRLREELRVMKNGSVQPLNEQQVNDVCTLYNTGKEANSNTLDEPGNMQTISKRIILSQKTAGTHQCCPKNVEKAEYPKEFSADVDCSGNASLASIIWSRKEPELYRNGYTQRIRALEHNILTSKGPFGEINGFSSSSKNEPLACTNEKLEVLCKIDFPKSRKTATSNDVVMFEETRQRPGFCEAGETGQESGDCANGNVKAHSGVSPRKQRATSNHSNSFTEAIYSDKAKSYDNSLKFTIHDKQNETEAPKENSASFILVSSGIHETAEDTTTDAGTVEMGNLISKKCSLDTSIKRESFGVKQCSKSKTRQSVNKQSQSDCENEILKNSLQNIEDEREWITMQDPVSWSTFSKNNCHPSGGFFKDPGNAVEVAASSKPEAENVTESSENSIRVEPETDVPLLHPSSKIEENGTDQTGTDKFLKYTFQRKRKRGCCHNKNEISFPEKRQTLTTKSLDMQNSVPEPSEPNLATDLPRNNRRLVQVARQLISLSEKRW